MAAARKSGAGRKAPACPVTAYAKAVTGGKITAGRLVKLACARHLEDLKTGKTRSLSWDRAAALHAIEFFSHLRHSTGEWAGQPFVLQPWQAFAVGSVFGWKRADGLRRFRTAYVEVARKNGKSALLAGIALYALIADGEAGAHVYAAATTRDQARIVFGEIGGLLATLAGSAWARTALRYGVTAFAILLFLLALRRSGERAGRLAGRLETTEKANDVQRQMLEAAARRPRDRIELAERLRSGRF